MNSIQDRLVVFGSAFCLMVLGYVVTRLCRRFFETHGPEFWSQFYRCFCCRHDPNQNGNPIIASMQRSRRRIESCLTKQPELIVDHSVTELRVGETTSFKVTLPENRNVFQRSSTSSNQSVHVAHPTPNSLLMLNSISIEIRKISGLSENISFIQELSFEPETREDFILVKYTVREAGFYEVHVAYQNVPVTNSPMLHTFLSTELDPEKTTLLRQSPMILILTVESQTMTIEAKDRFENFCRLENFSPSDFTFKVTNMDVNFKDKIVETMAYDFTSESANEWGESKCDLQLHFEIFLPGYFRGTIFYRNRPIGNGAFDLVCLTPEENQIRLEIHKRPQDSVFHNAKLLAQNSEMQKSPTEVYIYVSSKAVVVKQFFLSIFPFRLAFYRVLPATKVDLICDNLESRLCTFTLRDRMQPKLTLEMESTNFRIFIAIFAHFLKQRLGGSESFENKQKFFQEEVRLAREDKNRDFINISVYRINLIDSSIAATKGFGVREWVRKPKIHFEGEEGHDDGGLRREWLTLLCQKLFENDPKGLFCSMGNSRLVHPNPHRAKIWNLRHYEFAGKIVGKCLLESSVGAFHQQMVNGRFSRSFLAHLIGSFPQHKHFEQDDPELHLGKVKYILENDVTSMEMLFQEEEYENETGILLKTVDLIPNGKDILVTNNNKEEYLAALAQFRLGTRTQSEIDAFLKGLHFIIPEGLLSNFDENELEILMCGKSNFSVEDLKRNHVLTESGLTPLLVSKILLWFWNSVEGMSTEERGRLLQFTTGSSLLPNGGFIDLRPTFRITITNTTGHLPIAHTCFSEICLSIHNSFEEFNKSLRLAVNECSEGFAMM